MNLMIIVVGPVILNAIYGEGYKGYPYYLGTSSPKKASVSVTVKECKDRWQVINEVYDWLMGEIICCWQKMWHFLVIGRAIT